MAVRLVTQRRDLSCGLACPHTSVRCARLVVVGPKEALPIRRYALTASSSVDRPLHKIDPGGVQAVPCNGSGGFQA